MKKFVAILSVLNLVLVSITAVSKEDIEKHEEMEKSILIECKSMEGGTDEDFDALLKGETFPETKTGMCMMACVGEKTGYIKDGKFDKTGFIEMTKVVTGNDPKLMSVAEEIGTECERILKDISERCQMGTQLEKCIHEGIKSRKVEIGFM